MMRNARKCSDKLEKCSDEHSLSPVVITVKKDKSVKIAPNSKKN